MTTRIPWRRSGRCVGAAAAGAVILTLLPFAGPAQAAPTFDRGIARACPKDATDAFGDDDENVHEDAINCVAFWEITVGRPDGSYGVRQNVTRAQMATFIAKTMRTAGHEFPANPPDAFEDDNGNTHEGNINALAAEEVVKGDAQGNYNPDAAVRRDQMASFLNQALAKVTGEAVASEENFFEDDDGNAHEKNINALASIGVVTGTGAGEYSPARAVRRDAMASFIARGADYLAQKGRWPLLTDIGVEPKTAVAVEPSPSATSDTGARQYTVDAAGLDSVTIAIYPAKAVQLGQGGTVTVGPNQAFAKDSGVSIEKINGQAKTAAAPSAGVTQENDVMPVNNVVTFTIDSVVEAAVVPVVWSDVIDPGADKLDLADDGTGISKEPFGAGGAVSWIPNEAGSGSASGTVVEGNPAFDYYTLDTGTGQDAENTFYFDNNDTFQLKGSSITIAVFERLAGSGAVIDVSYNSSPSGVSTHNVTTSGVHPVPWVDAQRADTDGDGTRDDVAVHWGASAGPGVVYDVYRSDDANDCGETPADNAKKIDGGDALVGSNLTTMQLNEVGRQSATSERNDYYLVVAQDPTTGEISTVTASQCVKIVRTAQDPIASSAPTTTDAKLMQDLVNEGAVDGTPLIGDEWEIVFDGPVAVAANASITVIETTPNQEGKQGTLTKGQNAVFTLSADGKTLAVRVTDTLTATDNSVISYGVRIIGATGISNGAGAWNPLSPSNDDVHIKCGQGDVCPPDQVD